MDTVINRVTLLYVTIVLLTCAGSVPLLNAQVFISPTGSDTNAGTIDSPFKSLSKGASALKGNDTVYVRGGTYALSSTISISKQGADTIQYYIVAYPGERPFFDFTAQSSSDGIKLNGKYWHLVGVEVYNAAHNGIAINGSYNVVERCSVHDNRNTGMQLGNGASYNKIINCDSYFNYDPPLGGNADGFAPKLDVGTGNYFYGCRAWQNSDDGWDGYMRPSDSVNTVIENCWSFRNAYLKDGSVLSSGNGNGFKMGGGDNSNGDSLRHNMTLKNCISFDNRVKGFDQNNNRGSMTLLNCTGYRNGAQNFSISGPIRSTSTVRLTNCIDVDKTPSLGSYAIQTTDSWLPPFSVSGADFMSLDTTGVRGPRKADGSLPDVQFLHLASGTPLINAGTDVGLPFNGSAPDLGAFEFGSTMSVSRNNGMVNGFVMEQNFPNPFNPATTIRFSVARRGLTTLTVYNTIGEEVGRLYSGVAEPGHSYSVHFNGASFASGSYFSVLRNNGSALTTKMILLK